MDTQKEERVDNIHHEHKIPYRIRASDDSAGTARIEVLLSPARLRPILTVLASQPSQGAGLLNMQSRFTRDAPAEERLRKRRKAQPAQRFHEQHCTTKPLSLLYNPVYLTENEWLSP